ncbi:MAG: BamA/TamA family outer membrane protein [Spirochaetaceae bacterium]
MRKLFLWFLIVLLSTPLWSQESQQEPDRGIIPIPALGYTPETGFLLGVAAIYFSVPPGTEDPLQTTNIGLNLLYGTVGFFNLAASGELPLGGDRFYFEGGVGVNRANQEYFGLGLEDDGVEEFTQFQANADGAFLYRLTPNLRLGPKYEISYVEVLDKKAGGRLDGDGIEGSDWTVVSGPGVRAAYDTRTSTFFPRRGVLLTLDSSLSTNILGASSTFGRTALDGRIYRELVPDGVIAGQARLAAAYGDTPFQFLPFLGGQNELRGFNEGEIRDNVTLLTQTEFRFPLFWRLGGVAFFGVGTSGEDFGSILWDQLQPAGGGGIRFALNPEQDINLRLDFAHNGRNLAVYFGFGEAF